MAAGERTAGTSGEISVLSGFHPAVATWFKERFPDGPTAPQEQGWPSIRAGADTLIAAPTGSGKTLSGFLLAIDALYRAHQDGKPVTGATRAVYVSPLKALATDIHQNLETPLREIRQVAARLSMDAPDIQVAVRTGDTTSAARARMLTSPPALLVTTPESLYLLVTSARGREALRSVDTVIVDEIHAVARDKRGSHLALTLERLEHLQTAGRPQRIGLSATQRPLDQIGQLLAGAGRPVSVVDCGHQRHLDLALELPGSELQAVASAEQMGEVLDCIAEHVRSHRTTLVFVNTRRMAERLAHQLGERLGQDRVAAHHGSLSKERRQRVEARLRRGDLSALVATASLELGIDIGPVELVCQLGSPRAIATFLQRVGRANHSLHGVPAGRLFPLTRDELVECSALLAAVRAGRLDALHPPIAPLDILAQQVVAEVSAEPWEEEALFGLVRRAVPYAALDRAAFEDVLSLVSEGVMTGRGRRAAYLHRDRVHGMLRARRGARLAALTSGGAIPESGDYRVLAEPDETLVGTVNEDFAIESMPGDVFLLGSHSWRIRRVSQGVVRVVDAEGAHPTVPFWLGEAPARTEELSLEVSALRAGVDARLGAGDPEGARRLVTDECGVGADIADQLVGYLAAGRSVLGLVPTASDIVFERFFDETGGMQLVVHVPLGGQVNRGLGLALRKRFCATFDFELQAAANDDAVVLSLGPQHSFPLAQAAHLLSSKTVTEVLTQASLASPMFTARWRWNLNRSLAVLRFRGGRHKPVPLQRMEADDLMSAVFPALAACQENALGGPVAIPDHVLVRQTLDDCLREAMDVDGLKGLIEDMESGRVRVHLVDTTEPSVLAHEILNGRPYTFLDDAPLEERRTRAVQLRRTLPVPAGELGRLDPAAVDRVRDEAAPRPRDPEELHDLLCSLIVARPVPEYRSFFDALVDAGRASAILPGDDQATGEAETPGRVPEGVPGGTRDDEAASFWCAAERRTDARSLFPAARMEPDLGATPAPARFGVDEADGPPDAGEVAVQVVRGHLDVSGPVTVEELCDRTGLPPGEVRIALARLEAEGFALVGSFDPRMTGTEQWCARRLLARIHSYTHARLRREIEPVTAQDLMRFLLRWQHVAPGTKREGRRGLMAVIDQLQGFEVPAGAWEEAVLPARLEHYDRQWLQDLCLSGEVAWGRLGIRAEDPERASRRGASTPSRATPVTFAARDDLLWLLLAARGAARPAEPTHGAAAEILEALRQRGALFHAELRAATGRLPVEVEEGLWDLVARGLVTADGFQAVRSLFSARETFRRRQRRPAPLSRTHRVLGHRQATAWREGGEGRWALLPDALSLRAGGPLPLAGEPEGPADPGPGPEPAWDADALAEAVAEQLLQRWGVVLFDLMARETLALPWREVAWALRRLEARGLIRGGRFVAGFTGEQYALPEAVEELRRVRRSARSGQEVRLSAADPLNLVGVILPGSRVPAVRTNWVTYRDGLPLAG
jgi:ATP-dependent helicase Lhr and Lhr-like helicase